MTLIMEKSFMPFIGFRKSATKKEGLLTWVANVAGVVIPIAPVKASLTRIQFELATDLNVHFPSPLTCPPYTHTILQVKVKWLKYTIISDESRHA